MSEFSRWLFGDSHSHRCPLPALGSVGSTQPLRPPWTCGVCGRVWQVGYWGWVEIQGPSR